MLTFLKFSFTIINLSYIKQIDIQPNKYDIHLSDNKLKGSYIFLDLFSFQTPIICTISFPNLVLV